MFTSLSVYHQGKTPWCPWIVDPVGTRVQPERSEEEQLSGSEPRFLGRPSCNLATVLSVILALYVLLFAHHLCFVGESWSVPFVGPVIVTYYSWLLTVRSLKCGREINVPRCSRLGHEAFKRARHPLLTTDSLSMHCRFLLHNPAFRVRSQVYGTCVRRQFVYSVEYGRGCRNSTEDGGSSGVVCVSNRTYFVRNLVTNFYFSNAFPDVYLY
jgi:hypothetical protein